MIARGTVWSRFRSSFKAFGTKNIVSSSPAHLWKEEGEVGGEEHEQGREEEATEEEKEEEAQRGLAP